MVGGFEYDVFLSRQQEINDIESYFVNGRRVGLISGDAGIGKTTLARLFLNDRFGRDFGHDFFPGGVDYVYGYQFVNFQEEAEKLGSCSTRERSLLVIDEADCLPAQGVPALASQIDKYPNLCLLILSRDHSKFADMAQFFIALKGLSLNAFRELINKYDTNVNSKVVEKLWKLVNGNPALGGMSSELVKDSVVTWEKMIRVFDGFIRTGLWDQDDSPLNFESEKATSVITHIRSVNGEVLNMLKNNPERIRLLSSRGFEVIVAELLNRQGYSVELTSASKDGGVDIYVARRESFGEFLYLVECKHYTPPNKVGVEIVQKLYGVVQQQNANGGIIVTSSFFTSGAEEFQQTRKYQMHLKNYVELQRWLKLM